MTTLLAHYDQAMAAIATALQSNDVRVVKAGLYELEWVKLHAKQIHDRKMQADVTELQMKIERRMGVVLQGLTDTGLLAGRGGKVAKGAPKPATLKEIGVDPKLSMRAKATAELDDDAFAAAIAGMRTRMASGKAIMVDPINAAAKDAEIAGRRAAHAERTRDGGCIADLGAMAQSGKKFASIGMDPQWKFLTRSAAGEGRSANVHYKTEEVDKIKELPVGELAADDCALYMWMVDWCPQDALDLIEHYGFKHVTTAFTWVKTNGDDADLSVWDKSTFAMGQGYWSRANPEDCWLATRGNPKRLYADVRQLIVAPLMEHSRKPDEWLDRVERLTGGDYLELQARRPRKGWTSWGDELEWTGVAA